MRVIICALLFVTVLVAEPSSAQAAETTVTGGAGSFGGDAKITGRHRGDRGDGVAGRRPARRATGEGPAIIKCAVGNTSEVRSAAIPSCNDVEGDQLAFPVLFTPDIGPAAPTLAEVTAVVRDYVRTLSMPVPAPAMSAPEGITGANHSIDLRSDNTRRFGVEGTAFGQLRATAHGTFNVDWGDGTSNSYTSTGAPWPNSDIEHTWANRGTYDVTVNAEWTLDWTLGGFSGVITGLQTTGTIADWQVIEAQAVLVG